MFLQVFSKKVCFCCILGCFAEKELPQISQILTDGACLEFCEFCVLWEYSSPTDCTDQHRWLVALVVAWVRQDAIPSYICVNPCYLWEPLLNQKVLCASVPICGRYFSARRFCAFRAFCGRCFSARRFCVFRAFCGIYPCLFCWCSSCSDSR